MTSKKFFYACVGVALVAILCVGCAGTPATPPQSKGDRADFEKEVQQKMNSGELPFRSMTITYPEGASRSITNSTPYTATSGPPVSGSATSGDSKLVNIGTGSVAYSTDNIKLGLAMGFMEKECTRQGIHVLTRSDFEDKVRAVLKKNGADSIKLQYKDDGTTKTITVAP
jgi:hypothetical protein